MTPERSRTLVGAGLSAVLGLAHPAMAEPPPLRPAESVAPGATARDQGGVDPGAGLRASALRLDGSAYPYSAVAGPPDPLARGWRLTPSIAAQTLATDNLNLSTTGRRADIVFSLTPALLLEVETTRLSGILNYAPTLQLYGSNSDDNRVDQRFNGQLLVSLLPGALFIDLRGAAGVQAAGGGFATSGENSLDRNNTVQTTAFQVSPYLVHRFGSFATVQIGYALQHVAQEIGGDGAGGVAPDGQRFFADQDFTAHEFYAVARTGEDFGRFALEARATSTNYTGTGVLDGAYRRLGTVEMRYAITPQVAALVEGGYQQLHYAGTPGFDLSEPVWAVGMRLTLSPESRVTLKYGHRDGVDSLSLDAVVALGGRTTVYASYAERLTTGAQTAADLLSTTTLDPLGNPVDATSGAPVAQPFAQSFMGVQSSLMRARTGLIAISQAWPRDTITATLARYESRPISAAPGTIASPQSGTTGTLTWSHELTPNTTTIASVQYGTFEQPARGSGTLFAASAAVVHQFAPGLSGVVQLRTVTRNESGGRGRANENSILIGLRQSF